jgi:hypothetical protein
VLAAVAGVDGLITPAPENPPRLDNVSVSVPVLFCVPALYGGSGGLGAAALRASRNDLRKGLEEGGRGQAGSQGSQRVGRRWLRHRLPLRWCW